MNPPFPARLVLPAELSLALMDAAVKTLRATAAATAPSRRRSRRGDTLKPGPRTPLWNELVAAVHVRLTRYGEKARLARVLGLPRQRVNDLLRARRHLPDAERTLLLLAWLQLRSEGRDLA